MWKKKKPHILETIQRSIRFFLYRKEGADADKKLSRYQRKGVDMLKKQKYVTAVFCLFLSFFFAAMGILQYQMIRGKKPVSTDAGIEAMNNDTVLVGGMPIGIYMETDGVMVLNTEQIAGADGKEHEPAKGIVKAGDYIMAVDHCEITGKKELLEAVGNLTGTFVVLTVRRNGRR